MRTLKIAGFIAFVVVVLWLFSFLVGWIFFGNATDIALALLNAVLVDWVLWLFGVLVCAVGTAVGFAFHVVAGNQIIQKHAENCREKEHKLSMQIEKARNERAEISRKIEEQGRKRAEEVERALIAKNRASEFALEEREKAVSEREKKAEKREDAAYNAAQSVAQLRDLRSMYLAQIGRAAEALEDGNPGYAHKILTKHTKTYRPRRSRKAQNSPKRK